MSEWNYISIFRLLFQWNSKNKNQTKYIGLEQSGPHHIYLIEKEADIIYISLKRKRPSYISHWKGTCSHHDIPLHKNCWVAINKNHFLTHFICMYNMYKSNTPEDQYLISHQIKRWFTILTGPWHWNIIGIQINSVEIELRTRNFSSKPLPNP